MIWVVDASAAVEFLLRTPVGLRLEPVLLDDGARALAPELIDAEVLAVLRREHLRQRVDDARARQAIDDLKRWNLERISHRELLADAWEMRHNVSAYDALYVAVARRHQATLLTVDGPLTRAGALGVPVHNARRI